MSWTHPALDWVRLALGLLSVLLGLLVVVPAPNRVCFMLGVGVREWGHLFAILPLIPLLPGFRHSRPAMFGAGLALIGLALALSSIVRAMLLSSSVERAVADAFGTAPPLSTKEATPRASGFALTDVLLGVGLPSVEVRTIPYVTRKNKALDLDLYRGKSAAPAPLVVAIHGGSWRSGDKLELPALYTYLAARGYTVASLDYRLAPQDPYPAALEDIRAAVRFMKDNTEKFGIDPTRIVLLGRSAGGHLALLAGYTQKAHAGDDLRGVVALYPPTDMIYAYEHPSNPGILNSKEVLEQFLGGSPAQFRERYEEASPIRRVDAATPPTLLIHGGCDDIVNTEHSEMLAEKLKAAGRPHCFIRLPWAHHGCEANLCGPGGQISVYAIERFLAAVMIAQK